MVTEVTVTEGDGKGMRGTCGVVHGEGRLAEVRAQPVRERGRARRRELGRCENTWHLEGLAQNITGAITAACEAVMPARRRLPRSIPWWTLELTRPRTDTRRKRKRFQRERGALPRQIKEAEYRAQKLTYATKLEETKKEKNQHLLTTICSLSTTGSQEFLTTEDFSTLSIFFHTEVANHRLGLCAQGLCAHHSASYHPQLIFVKYLGKS